MLDLQRSILNLVGVTGFEPAASSSRTTRATKLRYTPIKAKANVQSFGKKFQLNKKKKTIRSSRELYLYLT